MRDLLKRHFGYDEFLPLQEEIISTVLEGKDALVLMPTGGGKSLCYQLPALQLEGLTLVVSPLIALMKDQVDALRANGIAAASINSTLPYSEISHVQGQAQRGDLKILYVAPERLSLPGFQQFLATLTVSLVAVDEAHCISVWGHDFRPDYRKLGELRRSLPGVPFLALTATTTKRVRKDIAAQLYLKRPGRFIASFNRANLSYTVLPKQGDSFARLAELLQEHKGESAIIYCTARKDTEEMAARLRSSGFDAQPYHAGLEDDVRHQTQERFIHDRTSIIVATIAFRMGIDKPNIRLLVHYNLPKSLEGYYQETGRAGRDGLPSGCVLFYAYDDVKKQEYFIKQIEDKVGRRNARDKLTWIVEFCQLQACRRRFLLHYFGEWWPGGNCGGCDFCLAPRKAFVTVIEEKILSAVVRMGERLGIVHDAQRDSRKKRVKKLGREELLGAFLGLCLVCLAALLFWGFSDGKQPQEIVRKYFASTPGPTSTPRPTPTPHPTATPTFRDWFDKGMANLVEGRYRAAIEDFDEAIRLNPVHAPSYANRGVAKGNLHRNEAAILDYSRAIELDPSDACVFHNRGASKARLSQFQEAVTDLDSAINKRPRFDEAYTSRGWFKMMLKQYQGAIDDFDQAIGMKSDLGTGSHIELCPAEEEPEQHLTPTPGSTPTSGPSPTPTPTSTPNPCPTYCFSDDEARYIGTYLGRGHAYYYLGDNQAALADLEIALEMAQKYGDIKSAESAQDLIDTIK